MMQMVGLFAKFEGAIIRERTSVGLVAARVEHGIVRRRKRLNPGKRCEIAENINPGRKSAADMAWPYNISQPTLSRIVAQHKMLTALSCS